jgi:hypothetical protein
MFVSNIQMKKSILILSLLILSACSSDKDKGRKISGSSSAKETDVLQKAEGFGVEDDTLAVAVHEKIAGLLLSYNKNVAYCRSISYSFEGYENVSEETWYIDLKFKLKYCIGSWESEGLSGKYTQFFRNDSLFALIEENSYHESGETIEMHTDFMPVYGYTRTAGQSDDGEYTENLVYSNHQEYQKKNNRTWDEYRKTIRRIRELRDKAVFLGEEVRITNEEIMNYGEDFTQREGFRLDRQLFNRIIRNEDQ